MAPSAPISSVMSHSKELLGVAVRKVTPFFTDALQKATNEKVKNGANGKCLYMYVVFHILFSGLSVCPIQNSFCRVSQWSFIFNKRRAFFLFLYLKHIKQLSCSNSYPTPRCQFLHLRVCSFAVCFHDFKYTDGLGVFLAD